MEIRQGGLQVLTFVENHTYSHTMKNAFIELTVDEIAYLRRKVSDFRGVLLLIQQANRGQYGEVSDTAIEDLLVQALEDYPSI